MARIWNSSIGENLSVKKLSNTINLKVGQRIYGRVLNKGENNDAVIKLLNGAELTVDIEGVLQDFEDALMNFKIEGFKDGKLQLKILQDQSQGKQNTTDLLKFIAREGLNKEDLILLEGMLKYNIPLSKENITEVKSLIQFQEKMINNQDEVKNFISNYLNSKEIPVDSAKGYAIANKLTQFFSDFKNLTLDNILTFLENEVDLSSENISSYNKLFKGEESIQDVVKNMKIDSSKLESLGHKGVESFSNDFESEISHKDILGVVKDRITISKELNAIFRDNKMALNSRSMGIIFNVINSIPKENLTKATLEARLTELVDNKVVISQEKFENICDLLGVPKDKDALIKVANSLNSNVDLKETIKIKENESKEIIKNLLSALNENDESGQLLGLIKSNITDIKLFNKFSNEYYYLNIPLNFKEKEYPCKLVIKDNRKEGKRIDSKNVKLALSIKTYNFGMINSFVKVNNNNMDIELKCDSKFVKAFELSKGKLKEKINSLGYLANIRITEIKDEFSLESLRSFFGDNNVAGIDVKV